MHIDTHLGVDVLAHEADEQLSVLIELTAPELAGDLPRRSAGAAGRAGPQRLHAGRAPRRGTDCSARPDRAAAPDRQPRPGRLRRRGADRSAGAHRSPTGWPRTPRSMPSTRAAPPTCPPVRSAGCRRPAAPPAPPAPHRSRRPTATRTRASPTPPGCARSRPARRGSRCARPPWAWGWGTTRTCWARSPRAAGATSCSPRAPTRPCAPWPLRSTTCWLRWHRPRASASSWSRRCGVCGWHNDLPAHATSDGVVVELGEFHAGETRRLLVTFDVPGLPALGLAAVARLELTWVEPPALVQHTVSVPLHVNARCPAPRPPGGSPTRSWRPRIWFCARPRQRAGRRRRACAPVTSRERLARSVLAAPPCSARAGPGPTRRRRRPASAAGPARPPGAGR